MDLDPVLPWIAAVGLVMLRLTVPFVLSPPLSSFGVPATVRVALALALAAAVSASRPVPAAAAGWFADPARLALAAGAELGIGALLGLSVQVVLAAFAVAGRLMDVQAGFAIGSVLDPVTRSRTDVFGALLSVLGVTLFFASGAHLELVRLVARSLDLVPLGEWPSLRDPMRPLVAAGAMFTLGVALAAPLAATLLLTDVAIGVTSRNMPQVNVLVLAIPVKIVVGLFVLSIAVRGWAPLVQQAFGRVAAAMGVR